MKINNKQRWIFSLLAIVVLAGIVYGTTTITNNGVTLTGSINNISYVAVGDISDLQTKINSCQNYCNIILSPGVYNFTTPLIINKSDIKLSGYGAVFTAPSTAINTILITNGDHITIEGIHFTDVQNAIEINVSSGKWVRDVLIQDIVDDKAGLTGQDRLYGFRSQTPNDGDQTDRIETSWGIDHVTIRDSVFKNYVSRIRSFGIGIQGDTTDFLIQNNRLVNLHSLGADATAETIAIALNNNRDGSGYTQLGHVVDGNYIYNLTTTGNASRADGIYNKAFGTRIINNDVWYAIRYGITSLRGEIQNTISDNFVYMSDSPNNDSEGIAIRDVQNNWTGGYNTSAFISFNTIVHGSIQIYGSSSTLIGDQRVIVIGNKVDNAGGTGIDESTTNTGNNIYAFNSVRGTLEGDFASENSESFQNLGYDSFNSNRIRGDIQFTGNISLASGSKFCVDGTTCNAYWYYSGTEVQLFTNNMKATFDEGLDSAYSGSDNALPYNFERNKPLANTATEVIQFWQRQAGDDQPVAEIIQAGNGSMIAFSTSGSDDKKNGCDASENSMFMNGTGIYTCFNGVSNRISA